MKPKLILLGQNKNGPTYDCSFYLNVDTNLFRKEPYIVQNFVRVTKQGCRVEAKLVRL